MVSSCILCQKDAMFTVVGLEQIWLRPPKAGKLKMLLCGLCAGCAAMPDALLTAEAVAFADSVAVVC
jgi:hypothetical protein